LDRYPLTFDPGTERVAAEHNRLRQIQSREPQVDGGIAREFDHVNSGSLELAQALYLEGNVVLVFGFPAMTVEKKTCVTAKEGRVIPTVGNDEFPLGYREAALVHDLSIGAAESP
jgi:hypothetical protein